MGFRWGYQTEFVGVYGGAMIGAFLWLSMRGNVIPDVPDGKDAREVKQTLTNAL